MNEGFPTAPFLDCWRDMARFDLSGSDSETLPLADLLALADPDDRARWQHLAFGYAEALGAPWLRDAIARRYRSVGRDGIVCFAGAQEAVSCVARAVLKPDDHAIVVVPIYQPTVRAITSMAAATGVPLDEPDWQLDVDRVAAAVRPNTKLVLTNFPNSPTGAVLPPERLEALIAVCRRHGLWLVNDEVYQQTDADADHSLTSTVVDAYERGVSINGLSKGFGLPGLRVGWAAYKDPLLRDQVLCAKGQLSAYVSSVSEVLAHVALRNEGQIIARARAIGGANRQRLHDLAKRCSEWLTVGSPRNFAFAFARYTGPGSAESLAERIARDIGVLVLPSKVWTSSLGAIRHDHLRIGLGHAGSLAGLGVLEDYLMTAA